MWPFFLGGAFLLAVLFDNDKKKVFISYDHSEDVHLRNLLEAWDRNPNFSFSMDRTSPLERIDSDNETVVKRALTLKLKKADYLLVIVGERASKSKFIRWEIERAQAADVNLRIAAVKTHPHNRLPEPLRGANVPFARSFTREGVIAALESAKRTHA